MEMVVVGVKEKLWNEKKSMDNETRKKAVWYINTSVARREKPITINKTQQQNSKKSP